MRSNRNWRAIGLGAGIVPALVLLIYAAFALLAQPAADHPFFANLPSGPLVIAHQGGEQLWPSNTLLAFENAVALGVDVLEMDIHSTADGVLVTIHDDTVDRTTDGSGRVNDLTLAQIKALDAGDYWSADDGATYPFRDQGITIATLAEVFSAFPRMLMNIEIKQVQPSIAQPLCDLIRQRGKQNEVLVASFRQQAMDDFRAACPEVATSLVEDEVRPFFYRYLAYAAATYSPAGHAVQVPERASGFHILTSRFVRAAHNRNMHVHAWTINETADMQRLLDLGLDGIITDRPDRLLALLGR